MKQTDIDLIYENRYYEGNRGMMEEYEDAILAAEASKRLSEKTEYTTQDNLMKKFGLTESDLDDIEVNLE